MTRFGLITAASVSTVAITGCIAGWAAGQPGGSGTSQAPNMHMDRLMMLRAMKPTDQHELLRKFVGEWSTTVRQLSASRGDPIETTGMTRSELIHDGRFLKSETTGTLLTAGPNGLQLVSLPLNGLGLLGYNRHRQEYTIVWTSTLSTATLSGSGSLSADGKTLTLRGELDGPQLKDVGNDVICHITIVDPDRHELRLSEEVQGKPTTTLEVLYVRKKPPTQEK